MNFLRKNYLLIPFIFCVLLFEPQINSNNKLIIGGIAAATALLGLVLYAYPNTPPSDGDEIVYARLLIASSSALLVDASTAYKGALSKPIEALKVSVKEKDDSSYALYNFASKLHDTIKSLGDMAKKLKTKKQHLIERRTNSSNDFKKQYDELISIIPSHVDDLLKLCSSLSSLYENLIALPEYERKTSECWYWLHDIHHAYYDFRSAPTTAAPAIKDAIKAFNPALRAFWADPFNY